MASVIDRLKKLNLDASYGGRQKLYQEYGLGDGFAGTADQNLRLASEAERRGGGGTGAPPPVGPPQTDFVKQATDLFDPIRQAATPKFAAQRRLVGEDFRDLETRLRERETAAQEGLRTDLSSRGFLRSGEQVGTGGRIAAETTRDINRADINRAIQEADLVLQEANFNVDFAKNVGNKALELRASKLNSAQTATNIFEQLLASEADIPKDLYEAIRRELSFIGG